MTGIVPVTGGLITGVDPNPGGATTPPSGIGRAPSANGFSLRGRGALPSVVPGGNVGESLRGRTTSGTVCATAGPPTAAIDHTKANTAARPPTLRAILGLHCRFRTQRNPPAPSTPRTDS